MDHFKDMTLDEAMANPYWDDITVTSKKDDGSTTFEVILPSLCVVEVPNAMLDKASKGTLGDVLSERLELDHEEIRAVMRWKARLLFGDL